ncbi:glutamate-rich protein 3 [Notolabrus celidotus]|uniref:glutamate-rich protein 3 n=1 Tax=Notolabrus celidotus TaxID=1203425 RepID=UPI0014904391|nr:glutamate-rich protein 3 [Notolabrus celidotus]
MSHLNPGLISAYNSLTDKHLAGYFSNTRIRRHLQRAGLITRSGRIVPDKEYRHKLVQRAHQRHVRECLAQAIFHKVLEMERVHQIEIKRKLEEFARRERVHKIKVERSKRYEEELIRILSPRPPTGARSIRKQHSGPEGEHSESSESPGSSRPNTAPGKMQRPVRLKPIHSNSTTASLRRSSPYRHHESSTENNQPFNCTVYRESRRQFNTTEAPNGLSPYCLPVINNFVTPVPPPTKRKERGLKVNPSGTLRGRRLRPTTASSGADIIEDPPMLRSSVHQSRVCVNMMYCGKTVHLSHDLSDMRDEIKVFQQHCGGENLCVYKGKLREGETFQFISRRHRGFPFSLTFFLNGLQVERLSSCCEFKHRKGSRLGGRHGHFGFCSVEGASPCYKCIIAMGLDKKPTPPPKRVKEDQGKEESAITLKEAPEMRTERRGSHSEYETSPPQADTEMQVKGEKAAEARDDYEEDFEADDEGPAEDTEAKERKPTSPSVDTERKAKEREDSETEDDNEKDDIKSRSGSSLSGSERADSDTETTTREEDKTEQPTEVDEEEAAVPPDEKDDPQPEEDPTTEAEPAAPKDSDVPNSAGESTEIDISDTSVPSGNKNKQSDDTSGEKEVDIMVHENKQEEEQERAKSVQEKLAEAILKESQCSSEPELSDTSTDDTVESTGRGCDRDHKDATAEKRVALIEEPKTDEEERKCEEGVVALAVAVAVLDQETMLEQKQAEDTKQEPPENSETTEEEEVKVEEEDKKVALEEDETPAEESKSDEKEVAAVALLAVSTEVTFENNKTPEAQEDVAGKAVDASEHKEENEEKAAGEADMHPKETGQGAKSSMEDESSVSESNKETDETAVTDTAEAEAMTASETMEIKAEPSEEREALSCEEAPVTGTETSQLGDDEDGAAASKTEVTEGSGDTPDEKTADTSEDDAKEESVKYIQEELLLALEACEDDNQQDSGDLREEQTENSDEKEEGKSEEEGKEEEKKTNADETTESEHVEESEMHAKDRTEEETNIESKTEEKTENVSNEEQAEKTHSEEKRCEKEEKADPSEKTENDEDGDCIKNKNDEEELIEKAAAAVIIANAAETITAADEQKKDQIVNKVDQSETVKTRDHEESQETKVVTYTTVEVEEKSEKEKEPRKRTDADVDEDSVKESDDNVESEAAVNAALVTVMTAEMLSTIEAEDVVNKTDNNEKGDINAENGEISTGEESQPQEVEGEAQTEGENGVVTAEQMENERKTEEQREDEVTAESVNCAEKHENVSAQASDRAEAETEAKEEDDNVEKQDQSGQKDSELEESGADLKGESESDIMQDVEETKQDENANLSEADYENREIKKSNSQENINEVIVFSSADQVQSTTPTAADSDETPLKSERSTALSDNHMHKHPNTDDNTAAADLSAADGENGDTEEASKASEEGASVLLKPQAQSEQPTQENEADKTEEKAAVVEETADVLAREDLVTNWVNVHQTSKFFETFVEPMEDLKEVTTEANSKEEVTQPTELQRSVSLLKGSETVEQEHAQDVDESVDKNKEESNELDIESDGKDGEPCKKDQEKDAPQVEEETEVQGFILKTESELNEPLDGQEIRSEDLRGRQGSLEEDKAEEATPQDNTDQADVSKTVVESIASAPVSVTSGRPESIPENQTEEKTADDAELNEKPTAVEEVTDLSASKTEEQPQHTDASLDFKDKDEMLEKSREVTEISELTESRSDDSSQKEPHHEEIKSKQSDANVNGEKRDLQLIQDITHTLSKERLSTFSVDETLFGPGSYPLLAAAQTDSGH